MGRRAAGQRGQDGAELRLAAAQRAGRRGRGGDRHARARLRAADRSRAGRRVPPRAPGLRGRRARPRPGAPASAAREALALFRGDPLADVADEPFADAEIRRLEELRLAAAELAIDDDLAAGPPSRARRRDRRACWPTTRCASGCTPSACSRSTAAGARPRRSTPTGTRRSTLVGEIGVEPSRRAARPARGDPAPGPVARRRGRRRRAPARARRRRRRRR